MVWLLITQSSPSPSIPDVTTVAPTFQTHSPGQPIPVQCAWSPWLNADSPDSAPGDLGDLETIDVLKQKYGLCPTITEVEVSGVYDV